MTHDTKTANTLRDVATATDQFASAAKAASDSATSGHASGSEVYRAVLSKLAHFGDLETYAGRDADSARLMIDSLRARLTAVSADPMLVAKFAQGSDVKAAIHQLGVLLGNTPSDASPAPPGPKSAAPGEGGQ